MDNEQKYYKHKYGGIYLLIDIAKNKSNNDEIMVVYQHIYPFEKATYVRKKEEFDSSNRLLTKEELEIELLKPRDEFQKEIMNSRKK
jgi:hypothetical protein